MEVDILDIIGIFSLGVGVGGLMYLYVLQKKMEEIKNVK